MKTKLFLIITIIIICFDRLYADKAMVVELNETITEATSMYVQSSIEEAENNQYRLVIFKLNTPGGMLESTRKIVQTFFNANVPIVVFVAPSGSRAASAGTFITLAANIAVMANGTNIGAAHPVGLDGSSDSTVMSQKIENDAAAFIRSIAIHRLKNADWAEQTVRKSISSTEQEALELGAIDYIVDDMDSLLRAIDGHTVIIKNKPFTLKTSDIQIINREKNIKEEILGLISNPQLVYILILIGIWGIIFEFKSPGSMYPGIIGAISLIIAAYSMQMLPINYMGVALILLAVVLFILEIFVQSYAILSIGAIISFAFGSFILIDSPEDYMKISLELILFATFLSIIFFGTILWLGIKAQNKKKAHIASDLEGIEGYAKSDISNSNIGKVHVNGEIWDATSEDVIVINDKIKVLEVNGFVLKVKKIL